MAEEGEEEPYVLKEVSKIPAITNLDDLVRQGVLKGDRAAYAKEKYEELRNIYISALGTERQLKAEEDEMDSQLKELHNELATILIATQEDEETLELVREDAEQAEAEAQICKEKEQAVVLEVTDLTRLQELYHEKIHEIEREHATALAPLLNRLKLEIQEAKDTIAESVVKKEQCIKEIEDSKEKLQETMNEIEQIHTERKEHLNNIEIIEGVPEKYRKQVDILVTAVKALQLQDQKWLDKVKEVESELTSLQANAKRIEEELVNSSVLIEKNRLLTEQKERQAADIARDLEVATLEVDDYLAAQVNVDMQLRARMVDLKMEQEQLASRTKEKDKALRRLKYEEQLVANIQAHLPSLIVDRDKIHHQVVIVENERKKVTAMVDELRREIDIQMHNFLVVEALGKEVASALHASHEQVLRMEKEVGECANIERLKNQHFTNLTTIRERLCRQVAIKYHMWKEALKKLHVEELQLAHTQKRDLELQQQVKDAVALYNLVRSQRNKYAALLQASTVSIAEMKDKLVTISTEVESLQSDVKYKDKVLHKQRSEYQSSVRGRTNLLSELTKNTLLLRETQTNAEEMKVEVGKLEHVVAASEREMTRTRKLYGLEVTARNQAGIALIDRNDELCILYEKSNVQVDLTKHSEVELSKRIDEIRYLKIQCKHMQQAILATYKTAPDFTKMYNTLEDLRQQLDKAKSAAEKLSDLVENPENVSRWRMLPGRDLTELELHGKITAIEEFLSAKGDQALEKSLVLEEITSLAEELKRQARDGREDHSGRLEKMNHSERLMQAITKRLMATVAELSLSQATAMSLKEERDKIANELDEAYVKLAAGEPPTEKAMREWSAKQREDRLLQNLAVAREQARLDQENAVEKRAQSQKSTAEQRPNAYIEEELGLPKPFGLYSPFRPSDIGANMRHFRKPEPKPVEL